MNIGENGSYILRVIMFRGKCQKRLVSGGKGLKRVIVDSPAYMVRSRSDGASLFQHISHRPSVLSDVPRSLIRPRALGGV